MTYRVAITGPESTGKSILSEHLAHHFQTIWVPEYAREYLVQINRPYNFDDILVIAKKQFHQMEQRVKEAQKYIFYDTELLVTKIWCDFKYGKCHPWIQQNMNKQNIDLYLLTDIDLPWQPDRLREHPEKRTILFNLYKNELESRKLPFEIVSGTGQQRTENAIAMIKQRFH
ncbi:MAG: ATP-binding protein [Bacteroidetes bacterium]|nr:ATP-binding protein [Bacteroidota bacterium]